MCREGQKLQQSGPWAPSSPLLALPWGAVEQAVAAGPWCAGSGWEEAALSPALSFPRPRIASFGPACSSVGLREARLPVSDWM